MVPIIIVLLGIVLWKADSSLEWGIPPRAQTIIETCRNEFSKKTCCLYFVWDSWPKEEELEKKFWRLQRELVYLNKKINVPFWIEVHIAQSSDKRQNEKYLSCLQRRFPEIGIILYSLCGEGCDVCSDT